MLLSSVLIISACVSTISAEEANDCYQRLTDLEKGFDRLETSLSIMLKMVCNSSAV